MISRIGVNFYNTISLFIRIVKQAFLDISRGNNKWYLYRMADGVYTHSQAVLDEVDRKSRNNS